MSTLFEVVEFVVSLNNYRGHCVAAITQMQRDSMETAMMIGALPDVVSYSDYVGVVSICKMGRSSNETVMMTKALLK